MKTSERFEGIEERLLQCLELVAAQAKTITRIAEMLDQLAADYQKGKERTIPRLQDLRSAGIAQQMILHGYWSLFEELYAANGETIPLESPFVGDFDPSPIEQH